MQPQPKRRSAGACFKRQKRIWAGESSFRVVLSCQVSSLCEYEPQGAVESCHTSNRWKHISNLQCAPQVPNIFFSPKWFLVLSRAGGHPWWNTRFAPVWHSSLCFVFVSLLFLLLSADNTKKESDLQLGQFCHLLLVGKMRKVSTSGVWKTWQPKHLCTDFCWHSNQVNTLSCSQI